MKWLVAVTEWMDTPVASSSSSTVNAALVSELSRPHARAVDHILGADGVSVRGRDPGHPAVHVSVHRLGHGVHGYILKQFSPMHASTLRQSHADVHLVLVGRTDVKQTQSTTSPNIFR